MLGWIPIIGPFLRAASSMFASAQNTKVELAKVDAEKVIEGGKTDSVNLSTRATVAIAFKDDIGIQFARDIIINWYAVYIGLIFYDSCFRNILPDWMTWRVLAIPQSLEYLCTAIIAFIFVTAWTGKK